MECVCIHRGDAGVITNPTLSTLQVLVYFGLINSTSSIKVLIKYKSILIKYKSNYQVPKYLSSNKFPKYLSSTKVFYKCQILDQSNKYLTAPLVLDILTSTFVLDKYLKIEYTPLETIT